MRKSEDYKKIITTHNLTHIKADLGIPEVKAFELDNKQGIR